MQFSVMVKLTQFLAQKKGCHLAALLLKQSKDQFENAGIPVIARPRIRACTSCVPS